MLLLGMDSMLCLEGSTSAVTSGILGLIHLAGIPGLIGLILKMAKKYTLPQKRNLSQDKSTITRDLLTAPKFVIRKMIMERSPPLFFNKGFSTDLTMGHLVEVSKETPSGW